jgi:PLP dependent protein
VCEALARQCEKQGRQPVLLVQVNIGAEPQKAGVLPDEVDGFLRECLAGYSLTIAGLMCIPPAGELPEPYFERLAELAGRNGLALLSMGMSSDFGTAIGYGATHVRVGSAIFGART